MKIILLVLIFLNTLFAQTTVDEKIVKSNGIKYKKDYELYSHFNHRGSKILKISIKDHK